MGGRCLTADFIELWEWNRGFCCLYLAVMKYRVLTACFSAVGKIDKQVMLFGVTSYARPCVDCRL